MNLLLFYLLASAYSLELKITKANEIQNKHVDLNKNSLSYVERITELGNILSIQFKSMDPQDPIFCKVGYGGMNIHRQSYGYLQLIKTSQTKYIDDLTIDEIYAGSEEEIISFAQDSNGLAAISNLGNFFYVEMNLLTAEQSYQPVLKFNRSLDIQSNETQQRYLVHNSMTKHFYYFEENLVLRIEIQGTTLIQEKVNGWNKPNGKFKIEMKNGFLYSAQGSLGLLIYKVYGTNLDYIKTITAKDLYDNDQLVMEIIDVQVWDDKVFILDKYRGISQFDNYFNGTFTKSKEFNIIPILNSISFTYSKNTMIVLTSTQSYTSAIELYIKNNEWMEMRRINTKSKLRKADIMPDFSILRGLHEHKIMMNKMVQSSLNTELDQVLNRRQRDEYFFSGDVIGFEQFNNSKHIIGISPHSIQIYNFKEYPTIILCDSSVQAKTYLFQAIVKSNYCEEKIDINDPLEICQTTIEYEFQVLKPLLSSEQQQMYQTVAMIFGVLAFILFISLCYYFRRYQIQQERIQIIIQKQINKRKSQQQINLDTNQHQTQEQM